MTAFSEITVKATRKMGICSACETMVDVGSPAIRWTGLNEGEFVSVLYHPECRAAEIALNYEQGTTGEEWQQLAYAVAEEPDNRLWLAEEHPAAAARLAARVKA